MHEMILAKEKLNGKQKRSKENNPKKRFFRFLRIYLIMKNGKITYLDEAKMIMVICNYVS